MIDGSTLAYLVELQEEFNRIGNEGGLLFSEVVLQKTIDGRFERIEQVLIGLPNRKIDGMSTNDGLNDCLPELVSIGRKEGSEQTTNTNIG